MTQFCVEEAVFERLHFEDLMNRTSAVEAAADPDPVEDPALTAARAFAEGRV